MTGIEVGLGVTIIGLLGLGGGKMWSDTAIKKVQKELLDRCKVCLKEREDKEAAVDSELKNEIRPRLLLGNLLMLELCDKAGIPKERVQQLKDAVAPNLKD